MGFNVTPVGLEEKSVKHELKKHAAIIHCSNPLSLLQRKISNALLSHAYVDLLAKEEHEISIRQLCHLIEYSGNNHAAIREALKGLLSTVIEWNVVRDGTGIEDWTASAVLASVSLRGPACLYAYSPRMKQLLYSPSMFGKINLYIQSRFKSGYGLALYENCIRYRGLPFTKWFEMEVFRKLMGVPTDNYGVFRDFKRRVLDKSVEEVNTYSDIVVEPELARDRRQVVKIRFALKERAKKMRLGTKQADRVVEKHTADLRSRLIMQFCLSPIQAEQVLQEYSQDFIVEKMQVVEASNNYQCGKVQNLAGYYLCALKNNYQLGKSSSDQTTQNKQQQSKAESKLQQSRYLVNEIEEAYLAYREKTIDQMLEQMESDQKKEFMQQFYLYAATSIETVLKLQRTKYNMDTVLNSPQIKGTLRQFALQTLPTLPAQLIPLEKFIDNFSLQHRLAWNEQQNAKN
jgi:plasmid replication initiation protein